MYLLIDFHNFVESGVGNCLESMPEILNEAIKRILLLVSCEHEIAIS